MFKKNERQDLIHAYTVWAYAKIADEWQPTLLTLTFNEIGGGAAAKRREMQREAERVYGQLLTRVFRRPAKKDIRELPLWFVTPDYPVHKRDRDHLRDVAPNDGRHLHAFALTPPFGRGGRALEDIVDNDQRFLVGGAGSLFRVHAVPVVVNPHVVVDYALKGLSSGRVSDEEVFVLPRLREEVI